MVKPATVLQREFKAKIVKAINEAGLPAFALIPILKDALGQLVRIDEEQYQADLKAIEEAGEEHE